jgi:hypothetical protein
VKTAAEYRQHANECRGLAKQMPSSELREQLLAMAETWERLAEDREAGLAALAAQPHEAPAEPPRE